MTLETAMSGRNAIIDALEKEQMNKEGIPPWKEPQLE